MVAASEPAGICGALREGRKTIWGPRFAVGVFLLGHLGIGLGLAWLLSWKSRVRVDYRLVLLGAILPDLIDKPLSVLLNLDTRLWAHTLLFLGAVLVLSAVPPWNGLRLIGFGTATHLLLDEIWIEPAVAWYPAFGWTFAAAAFTVDHWFEALLYDPIVQAGEILGTILLIGFAWSHGIRSRRALWTFVRRGTFPSRANQP